MPLIEDFRYRKEIDGLRGLAVSAVLLFHAGVGMPGGYVGVDVFFVISGYLIISLIVKDLEQGRFAMADFWERRVRRILPAQFVMTIVTLAAASFFFLPADFANLGKSAVYQCFGLSNFFFWRNSGYFSRAAEEKPLLHTWSLGVEEQFYLFIPFILLLLFSIRRFRSRRIIIAWLAAGFAVSFLLSIVGTPRYPTSSFYLLPTRAWEMLAGGIIAVLPKCRLPRTAREIGALICLAGIGFAMLAFTKQTPFPGYAALLPCAATAGLIYLTDVSSRTESSTIVARLLSVPPLVFIGLISYSLYLWHWPILAFSNYFSLGGESAATPWLLIAASLCAAVISWRFVETPFRKKSLCGTRRPLFITAAAATSLLLAIGLSLHVTKGIPSRFSQEVLDYAAAGNDMSFIIENTVEDVLSDKLTIVGSPDQAIAPTWMIWGDSHAMAAMPAFDVLLKERGLRGVAAMHSSTPPLLGYYRLAPHSLGYESLAFNDTVLAKIAKEKIPDVVLIARWNGCNDKSANLPDNNAFAVSLVKTVKQLTAIGAKPWILLQVPEPGFDVPRALAHAALTGGNAESVGHPQIQGSPFPSGGDTFVQELQALGALIIDPRPEFSTGTSRYVVKKGETVLYRDSHHLTTRGALAALLPALREAIPASPAPAPHPVGSDTSKPRH